MQMKLLDVLACPRCHGELLCAPEQTDGAHVMAGTLRCARCDARYPIRDGIPRFVPSDNYGTSFGYQWNRFRVEQLDSRNGTHLSHDRFYAETRWSPASLLGEWVLDVGCGAGRFMDVVAETKADVVGVDISHAVDAARENLARHESVHLVQASLYELPFRNGVFDALYCIGVIQHTPDPLTAVRALPRVLKTAGRIAVTIYEKRRLTPLCAKYLVRPFTRRLDQRTLLRIIQAAMPVAFPVTEVLYRVPLLARVFQFTIPVANYVENRQLSGRQRYAWALMDTFDMLAPRYDAPQTEADVRRALAEAGVVDVERTPASGLNLVGRKRPERVPAPASPDAM